MSKFARHLHHGAHLPDYLNPEYLRYYSPQTQRRYRLSRSQMSKDFQTRMNSDLVGRWLNIASRCPGFISKRFNGQLAEDLRRAGSL